MPSNSALSPQHHVLLGILDDANIRRYFELGCEVKGLGRGHAKRIKDQVKAEN